MRRFEEKKYQEFLADFNLFICETFGYRNVVEYNTMNEEPTLMASERDFRLYIRLREDGLKILPDNTVILVNATFRNRNGNEDSNNQVVYFEQLLQFLKAYAPLYGYNTIAIEGFGLVIRNDKTEYGFKTESIDGYRVLPLADLVLPNSKE